MKYFKRHIGDELLVVGRLPALARGIYWSLELYYKGDEAGLVDNLQDLAGMAGVNLRKKQERDALLDVLARFFVRGDDGCHHRQAWDRVITDYQQRGGGAQDDERDDGQLSPGAQRQRRYREEHQRRRAALADIGLQVSAKEGMPELRALCVQHLGATASAALGDDEVTDEAHAVTSRVTPGVTSPVTPVTPSLKPPTKNHEPSTNPPHPFGVSGGVGGGEAEAVTQGVTSRRDVTAGVTRDVTALVTELAAGGLHVRADDADLQRLADAGWTAQEILKQKPRNGWSSVTFPLPWLLGKLSNKAAASGGAPPPGGQGETEHWSESRKGIEAKAVELGLGKWDQGKWERGEMADWLSYRSSVFRAAGYKPEQVAG